GAKIIEKHIILDRSQGGPDASFSLEPEEFKKMVISIREVEKAMGKSSYKLSDKDKKNREFSRSLFVVQNIKKGELFNEKNIRSIRPGNGLPPKHLKEILGKKAKSDIELGTPLSWSLIE
ncbi:MAG TPA: N-acetylneuraminate synthase family protein, partial [bacterium]|nr:N-acetylneuraminate synthase family protein [bacterium]